MRLETLIDKKLKYEIHLVFLCDLYHYNSRMIVVKFISEKLDSFIKMNYKKINLLHSFENAEKISIYLNISNNY